MYKRQAATALSSTIYFLCDERNANEIYFANISLLVRLSIYVHLLVIYFLDCKLPVRALCFYMVGLECLYSRVGSHSFKNQLEV